MTIGAVQAVLLTLLVFSWFGALEIWRRWLDGLEPYLDGWKDDDERV
jgi:hypothetical protein